MQGAELPLCKGWGFLRARGGASSVQGAGLPPAWGGASALQVVEVKAEMKSVQVT